MREVPAKIIVEGGSAIPAAREVLSSSVALARGCERAPNAGADHGASDELVDISTGEKALRAGIRSRVLKRGIAFEPGKIRKAFQQIAHDLHPAAIGRVGSIGLSMSVVGAVALIAYCRGRIPLDPIRSEEHTSELQSLRH